MQTLAEFDAAANAKRAKLEAEIALAQSAVVLPKRTQLTSGGLAPWLTYEVETLADALAIMAAAPVVPFYGYRATFLRYQPESLANDKSGDQVSGPHAAQLDVSQGEGFGPGATLRFFVMAGETLCEAHIRIGAYHCPYAWGAQFIATSQGSGERFDGQRLIRGDWRGNNALSASCDTSTKWGTGDRRSAHYAYLWQADTVEGGCEHAAEQLRNLVA